MKRILVIDDEEWLREMVNMALTQHGYAVIEAPNGAAGVELARKELPDLVLCDVKMEKLDGYGTLSALRNEKATATIPFILMTGQDSTEGMRHGMELGANDYLPKPFTLEGLYAAVEARLKISEKVREQAGEALQDLRSNLSMMLPHELRTPLAAITAYAETLLDGGLDDAENSLRFLHTIQRNAERMRALVNDIAELSAIESGQVQLSLESIPLRRCVKEIFSHLAPRAAAQQVTLYNDVDESVLVTADPRRLEQILINLIDNAIKFNRPDGMVTVGHTLSTQAQHFIQVRDTGSGIPAEHLPRVFERFYRVDKARSRAAGGTGLGLAIVKHLALAHGGEASVRSETGQGCEFTIKLPVRAETNEAGSAEPKIESAAALAD